MRSDQHLYFFTFTSTGFTQNYKWWSDPVLRKFALDPTLRKIALDPTLRSFDSIIFMTGFTLKFSNLLVQGQEQEKSISQFLEVPWQY